MRFTCAIPETRAHKLAVKYCCIRTVPGSRVPRSVWRKKFDGDGKPSLNMRIDVVIVVVVPRQQQNQNQKKTKRNNFEYVIKSMRTKFSRFYFFVLFERALNTK